jgi:tagaturonate reductase
VKQRNNRPVYPHYEHPDCSTRVGCACQAHPLPGSRAAGSKPEKQVLQFGTGVIAGPPDFIIDQANCQGCLTAAPWWQQPTGGNLPAFERQNGLYTVAVRGPDDGRPRKKRASISRVLIAPCGPKRLRRQPRLQVVVVICCTKAGIQPERGTFTTPPLVSGQAAGRALRPPGLGGDPSRGLGGSPPS